MLDMDNLIIKAITVDSYVHIQCIYTFTDPSILKQIITHIINVGHLLRRFLPGLGATPPAPLDEVPHVLGVGNEIERGRQGAPILKEVYPQLCPGILPFNISVILI